MLAQLGSLAGAVLVLGAYAAQQFGRMSTTSVAYALMNFVGSGLLATVAAFEQLWGFVILNSVWALVSVRTLARRPAAQS